MSVETTIYSALATLVDGEVYQDLAPKGARLPRFTYFAVGGEDSTNYLDRLTIPDTERCRVQVNSWAATRDAANALARAAENALRPVSTKVWGSIVAFHEAETGLYGARQDFTFLD